MAVDKSSGSGTSPAMDAARRYRSEIAGEEPPRLQAVQPGGLDGLEKVMRFSLHQPEAGPPSGRGRSTALTAHDISQALDLVHDAAQKIRAAEERARDGEARTQALLQRATEELKAAEARTQTAEAKTRAAEARAEEAEMRCRESENWLRQIFATISEELPAKR